MAYVQRKIPFVGTPDTNPETKPFFDGAAEGKLLIKRCTRAGRRTCIRAACARSALATPAWEQASGKGESILQHDERGEPPYAIAYVTLAEGPRADQLRRHRPRRAEDRHGREREICKIRGRRAGLAVLHPGIVTHGIRIDADREWLPGSACRGTCVMQFA